MVILGSDGYPGVDTANVNKTRRLCRADGHNPFPPLYLHKVRPVTGSVLLHNKRSRLRQLGDGSVVRSAAGGDNGNAGSSLCNERLEVGRVNEYQSIFRPGV